MMMMITIEFSVSDPNHMSSRSFRETPNHKLITSLTQVYSWSRFVIGGPDLFRPRPKTKRKNKSIIYKGKAIQCNVT